MAIKGNGATGWSAKGIAVQAASLVGGYTLFAWARLPSDPATESAVVSWGGATFVHTAIHLVTAGVNLFDVDNAFTGSINGVGNTFAGVWQPMCLAKRNQSNRTLYVGSVANKVNDTTALSTQTLTDLYVGVDGDSGGQFMVSNGAIAEVAGWYGELGPAEIGMLMSGYCPLRVNRARLIFYFPLRTDLKGYSSRVQSLSGVAPVYTDHPKVQDYRDLYFQNNMLYFPRAFPIRRRSRAFLTR